MTLLGTIASIHSGRAAAVRGKPGRVSGINKQPLAGPVAINEKGIPGDAVIDLRYHGGPFKALCVYTLAHYDHWRATMGLSMPPGSFGENLCVDGFDESQICLGDIWRFGTVRARVAGPRGPCGTLAAHWGHPNFHLHVKEQRRMGCYLAVITPGTATAGDAITLEERTHPQWDIRRFYDVVEGTTAATRVEIESLLAMPFVDVDWHPKLNTRLRRATS
jgi:MOSC domain-containing protein YiiM